MGCAVDGVEDAPLGTEDPNALKNGVTGGSPNTVVIEVPYERPSERPSYGTPIKATGVRIGACTVLTAAHVVMSAMDYAPPPGSPTKPGWLLNWAQAKVYSIVADGGLDYVRVGQVIPNALAVHPSVWDREEVSNQYNQPTVVQGEWPPVDSMFDIAVLKVLSLPNPGTNRLPTLADMPPVLNSQLSVDGNKFDPNDRWRYVIRQTQSVTMQGSSKDAPFPSFYTDEVLDQGNSGGPVYTRQLINNLDTTTLYGLLSGNRSLLSRSVPFFRQVTVAVRVDGAVAYKGIPIKTWIQSIKNQHETDQACFRFPN